jgi:hypothetical protein
MTEMSAKAAVCVQDLKTAAYRPTQTQTCPPAIGQNSPFADPQYYGAIERHLAPIFRALADILRDFLHLSRHATPRLNRLEGTSD